LDSSRCAEGLKEGALGSAQRLLSNTVVMDFGDSPATDR
jgi:hypothetical protein